MNAPTNKKNRPSGRRHDRAQIPLLVQYRFGPLEELHTDYALNVSKSGLFIDSDEAHAAGTRVVVQLTSRDGQHFLQGEGKVVRAGSGCAIELTDFDDDAQKILDGWVKAALADDTQRVGPATRRKKREP
ncbi:MAG: hypothetical protein GY822_26985 [Deltaproteobacteria bacterium]|nr:hypothetical protein [Deltaproteobacteria bacterium]